jgi:6-methylsalicylate decarboxylase
VLDTDLRIDVHQHLWPEEFLAALGRRRTPPFLRREGSEWVVRVAGEPESIVDLAAHDPRRRAARLADDGLERALIASSLPLGVEGLPRDEAAPLLAALNDGLLELPADFGVWGSIALDDPDPGDADRLLRRGAVGIALPASAIADRAGLVRLRPVFACLEASGAALFVHPGPVPAGTDTDVAPWWPALTSYVAQMNSAWHAWAAYGRRAHPTLRVVFAMLAGLAPLQGERLAARGGPVAALSDPLSFYDTSSYGTVAIDAMAEIVGREQIVFGSDRPVIDGGVPRLQAVAA